MIIKNFEKNTIKKVLICFIIALIIISIFEDNTINSLVAFIAGTSLGILKLILMGLLYDKFFSFNPEDKVLSFLIFLGIILIYGIAMLSVLVGIKFFVYLMIGLATINFVLYINNILELLGISKNKFNNEVD